MNVNDRVKYSPSMLKMFCLPDAREQAAKRRGTVVGARTDHIVVVRWDDATGPRDRLGFHHFTNLVFAND